MQINRVHQARGRVLALALCALAAGCEPTQWLEASRPYALRVRCRDVLFKPVTGLAVALENSHKETGPDGLVEFSPIPADHEQVKLVIERLPEGMTLASGELEQTVVRHMHTPLLQPGELPTIVYDVSVRNLIERYPIFVSIPRAAGLKVLVNSRLACVLNDNGQCGFLKEGMSGQDITLAVEVPSGWRIVSGEPSQQLLLPEMSKVILVESALAVQSPAPPPPPAVEKRPRPRPSAPRFIAMPG